MFAAALLAATLAAPVPKAKAAGELYFPTAEGTKRVMERTANGQTTETTETVSKVEEKDGKWTVTVDQDSGAVKFSTVYEVSDQGVFRTLPNGTDLQPLLKAGKAGDSWAVEPTGPGVGGKSTHTLGKEEEVEVPAGKYKAVPVTTEADLGGQGLKSTTWYAAGVGVVKRETSFNGRAQTQVLKSFTPGKAK